MAGRPHAGGASYTEFDYGKDDPIESEFIWRGGTSSSAHDDFRYTINHPGEPIHTPRRRGSSMGRALVVCLALSAGGWGALQTEELWRPWVSAQLSDLWAAVDRASQSGGQQEKLQAQAPTDLNPQQPAEPIATRELADAPSVAAGTAVGTPGGSETNSSTPADHGGQAAAASASDTSQKDPGSVTQADSSANSGDVSSGEVTPLPPPKVDPADPYQKRALAVGLHPELSRALLSRMSDADYRNAGVAIKKAVAEVGDSDKFVWPRQREPKLALFKVHFVAGAPPDCRRYVVVVTKDGWSTTAQPMERCGVKRPRHSARAISVPSESERGL